MRGHVKRKDKNWYVVLELEPIEIDGKTKRNTKWISVRKELGLNRPATKPQAQDLLIRKLKELQDGLYIPPSDMTVAQLMEIWLRNYAKPNMRETTYLARKSYVKNHINPALGHIPVTKLKPLHLREFYTTLLEKGRIVKQKKDNDKSKEAASKPSKSGLATSTITDIHKTIKGALKAAAGELEIVQRNVADSVSPPRVVSPKAPVWTADQANAFLEYVRGHRLYPLYYLTMTTGMRRGEVLGLRWQDVNWDKQTIAINQALIDVAGTPKVGDTKTAVSVRTVAVSPAIITELRQHRTLQLEELMGLGEREQQDLVFLSTNGTAINPRNLLRHFQTASKRAGLPVIPFHSLRHTCATIMLQQNIHPKVVSERLGHARIGTTMDIYSHVLPDMQSAAADQLEKVFRVP